MDKVYAYMCLQNPSIKSTAGNKTRLFPSPFFISTSWFVILVEEKLMGFGHNRWGQPFGSKSGHA